MNHINIINKFHNILNNSDKLWIIRKRKINTKFLFYALANMIIHTCGIKHHISMQKLISNMNYNISDAALCKSR